mgnify:CR=1 FL=1
MSKIDISKYFTPDLKQARKRTNQAIEELKFELSDAHRKIGTGKFYYIHTYGCQGNEADSESIAGILELMGFAKSEVEAITDYPSGWDEDAIASRNKFKYYCPICLRYFNHILISNCCNNYICRFCIGQ